jgi:hypothetical protein
VDSLAISEGDAVVVEGGEPGPPGTRVEIEAAREKLITEMVGFATRGVGNVSGNASGNEIGASTAHDDLLWVDRLWADPLSGEHVRLHLNETFATTEKETAFLALILTSPDGVRAVKAR